MPAEEIKTGDVSLTLCKRCHDEEATLQIRSESVCKKCFCQYVTTKAIKRMETYRVRGSTVKAQRKLLLPLSFGPSSSSLLHILDQHIEGQYARMNRSGYELFVVHIDVFLDPADRKDASELLEKYKGRFSRHTYSSVGLEEALLLDNIDWKALGIQGIPDNESGLPATERLQKLLGSMSSATSRADIASTLLTRLLVDVAKRNHCESILFGESTTRLAEKTLTETAKGRGFSLPWQVSDGASPYGIGFNYPLRDLLKKEIVTFTSLTTPPLTELVIFQEKPSNISASSKTTTIDDLMAQYFESVEENYPSIVANVVRTSSKLQPLIGNDTTNCGLCGLPVTEGTDGIYGWGGDQNSDSRPAKEDGQHGVLCYGCSRSING
ncbi:Cytoplasmic tRNA 2-thiolation protein [Lachnellula suecica]|uniref:Cytoplasmic tRNA 2-thiolation protein 2 n=1 Tax=Lachnellula suecica TaxID=602035 RepID=A0A8T9BVX3_9HELO|nr:Cytoplasmic tRNA 2-thiolation protein [Lachnellula suecica]